MNILIVRLDNMGDIITTLGISCKIKERYPTARVVYLVRKINAILPQMYGYIDNVIAYDAENDEADVLQEIQGYCFDYIIDLKSNDKFCDMLQNLNIPIIRRVKRSSMEYMLKFIRFDMNFESYKHVKIATSKNTRMHKVFLRMFPWLLGRVKNNKLLYLSNIKMLHESQIAELFLFPLGLTKLNAMSINSENIASNFKAIGDFPTKVERYFAREDRFNLVLHPGSNGHGKEWPLAKYIELVKALDQDKYNIFITGSSQEWLSHGKAIYDSCPNVINLSNKFSLQEFVIFLTKVDALIASGTGPLHLAAAIGVHAVGLFPARNGINSSRWRPLGRKVIIFEEEDISMIKIEDIKNNLEQVVW
jgi:heptosyltransferase III